MTTATYRRGSSWSARLLIGVALMLAGAAAAAWALGRYEGAARFLGVEPEPKVVVRQVPRPVPVAAQPSTGDEPASAEARQRIAELEARLAQVEGAAQRVEGSAGRADALLLAFAARRAVERGLALGYLEPLLVERFGSAHPRAVATIVSGARTPVQLHELLLEYQELGPDLRSGGAQSGWWDEFKRELRSLVSIRHSDKPSGKPDARYRRASEMLADGEVDAALAETMRLPGATKAQAWVAKARRYVAIRRALDEIESAALIGRQPQNS